MARSGGDALSHLYGIAGLVPGVVGLVYLVKTDAPWQDYALLASGWVAAFFYGIMVWRSFAQARADGEVIGRLSERVQLLEKELGKCNEETSDKVSALEAELGRRNALLDYLAGLLMSQTAVPRVGMHQVQGSEGKNNG